MIQNQNRLWCQRNSETSFSVKFKPKNNKFKSKQTKPKNKILTKKQNQTQKTQIEGHFPQNYIKIFSSPQIFNSQLEKRQCIKI